MFLWADKLPTVVAGLIFVVAFVLFGCAGVLLTRSLVRRHFGENPDHNERVTFIVNVVGLFYALLVGLVAVAAYGHYGDVQEKVLREATAVGTLYRDASGFPEPVRGELQTQLRDYNRYVIQTVWPQQQQGTVPHEEVTARISAIQDKILAYDPGQNRGQGSLQSLALGDLNKYVELRRERVYELNNGLLSVFYYVMLLTAVVLIAATWLLVGEKLGTHLLMTGSLALCIGLFLFLIVALDYPLRGSLSIGPAAFETTATLIGA